MKGTSTILGIGLMGLGLTMWSCGNADQKPATETAQEQTAQTQTPAATAEEYPIDWCIVSGEKLGGMGDPVVYHYQGKTVKFCCNQCVKIFEKAPDAFMARLDSAATGLLMPPGEEGMHEEHTN